MIKVLNRSFTKACLIILFFCLFSTNSHAETIKIGLRSHCFSQLIEMETEKDQNSTLHDNAVEIINASTQLLKSVNQIATLATNFNISGKVINRCIASAFNTERNKAINICQCNFS